VVFWSLELDVVLCVHDFKYLFICICN
jgi:hypothetical protein